MRSQANTVDEYIDSLEPHRKFVIVNLRNCLKSNLPTGFHETMDFGMPTYVVPLSIYHAGYHCKKNQPLPFISFASQKNYVAVYHMGLYADDQLLSWFKESWNTWSTKKLDMGKSCIRLKDMNDVPYALFGELATKVSVADWIARYESRFRKPAQ